MISRQEEENNNKGSHLEDKRHSRGKFIKLDKKKKKRKGGKKKKRKRAYRIENTMITTQHDKRFDNELERRGGEFM